MAVLLVLALGISLFLSVAIQTARYSILRHDFRVEWYVFVLWAAAFALLYAAWRAESRREAGRSGASLDVAARRSTTPPGCPSRRSSSRHSCCGSTGRRAT